MRRPLATGRPHAARRRIDLIFDFSVSDQLDKLTPYQKTTFSASCVSRGVFACELIEP